jgi:hypothetical protein
VEWTSAGALVTPNTLRHDLIVVLLPWVVHVIFSVAADTIDLVEASLFLDALEDGVVTLTAFCSV